MNKLLTPLLLSAASALSGAVIFEDYFDYGANSNLGTNSPWTQSTNNVRYREAVNLSFSNPSYDVTSANTSTGGVDGSGNAARISVADLPGAPLTGEVWVSFLLRPRTGTSDPEIGTYTALNLGSGNSNAFDNNSYNTSTSFGFFADDDNVLSLRPFIATGNSSSFGTSATLGSNSLSTGNVTFLVLARAQVATSTLNVWFFEEGDTFGATVAGLGAADVSTSSALLANITRVGIGKTGNGRGEFDALRLSNTAGDAGLEDVLAVPEPGTYAVLFGALALSFVILRRRLRA